MRRSLQAMIRAGARLRVLAALGDGILLCIVGGAAQRLPGDIGDMTPDRTALYLGPHHDHVLWPALVFLPFAGLLAVDLLRHTRPKPLPIAAGGL